MTIFKILPTFVRNDVFTQEVLNKNDNLGILKKIERNYIQAFYPPNAHEKAIQGSREHFFHFLIGYLLPVVSHQSQLNFKEFSVVDCGPIMTPILEDTLNRLHYQFKTIPLANIKRPYYIEQWDMHWTNIDPVRSAIEQIKNAYRTYECSANHSKLAEENLLITRSHPHDFYLHYAEIKGYGTSRRAIENWQEISEHLFSKGVNHILYEPGIHSLGCQIHHFKNAKRIVGMRGAEWANAIWADQDIRVRVTDPNPPAEILINFLTRLNVNFEFSFASKTHLHEDPQKIESFLTSE